MNTLQSGAALFSVSLGVALFMVPLHSYISSPLPSQPSVLITPLKLLVSVSELHSY